eukprot:tig00000056_g24067.t2
MAPADDGDQGGAGELELELDPSLPDDEHPGDPGVETGDAKALDPGTHARPCIGPADAAGGSLPASPARESSPARRLPSPARSPAAARAAEQEAAPPRDSDAEEYEALQELSLRLLEEYDLAAAAAAAAAAPEPPAEPPPGPPPEPEPLSAPPPARASSCSLSAARATVPCTVATPERSRSGPPAGPASTPGAAAAGAKRPAGPAGAPPPPAKRPRTLADLRAGEQAEVLGVVMQIFPEQAVLCGSEHISTSNVIVADRSGERLHLTFWRAGAAWAQRLWPGDVLQVFSVALKEWQGQVTGNVGRASDARVLRRLRTGPERAPEPYGRPLHPPPDPEIVDGLATWAAEHHAPHLRPAAGPPRPRPPPRGAVEFAPSLAALQPDTLLHVRVRVLARCRPIHRSPARADTVSGSV